jgi:hypothetical protein
MVVPICILLPLGMFNKLAFSLTNNYQASLKMLSVSKWSSLFNNQEVAQYSVTKFMPIVVVPLCVLLKSDLEHLTNWPPALPTITRQA